MFYIIFKVKFVGEAKKINFEIEASQCNVMLKMDYNGETLLY